MRVLLCKRVDGAFGHILGGWANALCSAGIAVEHWDGNQDSWHRFAPDLYCGASGHRQQIPVNRGGCKLALHVNPYCDTKIEPNIDEAQEAINWVTSQKPDVVFGYGHESDRPYWAKWDSLGVSWVPMATAGDATKFNPIYGDHKTYDIAYIGGRWAYKGQNLDPYLLPVFQDKTIHNAVYGWGGWPFDFYKGIATDEQVPMLLASCKVAPCVSEPHTIKYGIDLPERVFKAALSGAVVVHDAARTITRHIPSVIIAPTPHIYHQTIKYVISMSDTDRAKVAIQQRQEVLASHTYHHRLAVLFEALGFVAEAKLLRSALLKYA